MSFDGDLYPEAGASKVITSKGDLVRGDASGNRERYGIGSTGQVLSVQSGTIDWIDADSITHQVVVTFACGDETTAVDATGQKISFRMTTYLITSILLRRVCMVPFLMRC